MRIFFAFDAATYVISVCFQLQFTQLCTVTLRKLLFHCFKNIHFRVDITKRYWIFTKITNGIQDSNDIVCKWLNMFLWKKKRTLAWRSDRFVGSNLFFCFHFAFSICYLLNLCNCMKKVRKLSIESCLSGFCCTSFIAAYMYV